MNKSARVFLSLALPALIGLALYFWPEGASAQNISLDFGGEENGTVTGRVIQLVLVMTVLSLAPSILVMMTSFTRILIVLSLLRQAI